MKAELWSTVIHAYTASEVMAPKLKTEEVTVEESDFTAKNDSPWLCVWWGGGRELVYIMKQLWELTNHTQ